MSKPRITKNGIWWQVTINGRLHAAHRTHLEAWERAWAIATYAQKIRERKEVRRIHAALSRMEENCAKHQPLPQADLAPFMARFKELRAALLAAPTVQWETPSDLNRISIEAAARQEKENR